MVWALNKLQLWICHKTKPNQTKPPRLVSLFNGMSIFAVYLMPKSFLSKRNSDTI